MRALLLASLAFFAVGCGCGQLDEEEYPKGPPPTFPDDPNMPKPGKAKLQGGGPRQKAPESGKSGG
jgi:hypothetical protein